MVVPGLEYHPDFWSGALLGRNESRRTLLYFRGTVHHPAGDAYSRGLRIVLEEALANRSDVVYEGHSPACGRDCYMTGMRRAVFCLCPRGWTPWTLRTYQARRRAHPAHAARSPCARSPRGACVAVPGAHGRMHPGHPGGRDRAPV